MEKIKNIIYGFLTMVMLSLIVLLLIYTNVKPTDHNTTDVVSIEITKVEKSL